MFRRKPPETLLLETDAPSSAQTGEIAGSQPPLAEPVPSVGGANGAAHSIECACPPSHVRLRKALFTVVLVLIVFIALAGAYVIWSSQH